jgi:hypothetical protein
MQTFDYYSPAIVFNYQFCSQQRGGCGTCGGIFQVCLYLYFLFFKNNKNSKVTPATPASPSNIKDLAHFISHCEIYYANFTKKILESRLLFLGIGTSLGSVGPPAGRPGTGPKLGYRIMKSPPCTKMVHKFTDSVRVHQSGAQLERHDVSER